MTQMSLAVKLSQASTHLFFTVKVWASLWSPTCDESWFLTQRLLLHTCPYHFIEGSLVHLEALQTRTSQWPNPYVGSTVVLSFF